MTKEQEGVANYITQVGEANISFNCFLDHEDGYGGQITIRASEADEWGERFHSVIMELEARGYTRSVRTPKADEPRVDSDGVALPLTIEVQSIKLASGGENPRWVVKGGKFTKYGITCWPEVLEKAGLKLDPMKENTPTGKWTATYLLNEEGKPDKVVLLERE